MNVKTKHHNHNKTKYQNNNKKIDKKVLIIIVVLILIAILILCCVFYKRTDKVFKNGNNTTSQEIVDYILNINSYEVTATIQVTSNKNENKYILKQEYVSPDVTTQEVIEPSNIAGIKIINDGTSLKLENSQLNLITMFDNYTYLGDNCLDLISFINDYKQSEKSQMIEEETQIIMKTESRSVNQYTKQEVLYIDKETAMPTKLEIKDDNENTRVYILYNEVKINGTTKENVLAFELYNSLSSI